MNKFSFNIRDDLIVDDSNLSKGFRLNNINYVYNDFNTNGLIDEDLLCGNSKFAVAILGENYLDHYNKIVNIYEEYKNKIFTNKVIAELELDKINLSLTTSDTLILKNISTPTNKIFNTISDILNAGNIEQINIYSYNMTQIYSMFKKIKENYNLYIISVNDKTDSEETKNLNNLRTSILCLFRYCKTYYKRVSNMLIKLTLSSCPLYEIYTMTCYSKNITPQISQELINGYSSESVFKAILEKHNNLSLNDLFDIKKKYIYVRNNILLGSDIKLTNISNNVKEPLYSYLDPTDEKTKILKTISLVYTVGNKVVLDYYLKNVIREYFTIDKITPENFLSFYSLYYYHLYVENKVFTENEIFKVINSISTSLTALFLNYDSKHDIYSLKDGVPYMFKKMNDYIRDSELI